jgi:HAD superfamily hydrolase (TIGR01509 family)
MGRVSFQDLDAVTIDGHRTLLRLVDPIGELARLLPGYERTAIEDAFRVEGAYYETHAQEARDAAGLAQLRAECAEVFNERLGSTLTPDEYVSAFTFEVIPGVVTALARLRALGLALAVVANWDFGLHQHLEQHGLDVWFDTVVSSAETGVKKPDPAPFRLALERLGVEPGRALHVGDRRPHDEVGALAAGMRFAPAPLEAFLGA